jgi:hypothetical protein
MTKTKASGGPGTETPGPPATPGVGAPSMTIHTVPYKNGADLTEGRVPNSNERIGSWIAQNWKWVIGILLAAGYLSYPVSTTRVDTMAAKMDSNQQAVVLQITEHEKRLEKIDGTLARIEMKLDNFIQAHISTAPTSPPPTPPRRTSQRPNNGLLSLFNPRR